MPTDLTETDLPGWLDAADEGDAPPEPDLSSLLFDEAAPDVAPPTLTPPPVRLPRPEPFEYGVVLYPPAGGSATGVRVEHDVPAGVRVLSSAPRSELSRDGRRVTWRLDAVPPGKPLALRLRAVGDGVTARASGDRAAFRATYAFSAETLAPLIRPALAVTVTGPATVEANAAGEFTVRVGNAGNWPLTGITARAVATGGVALASPETLKLREIAVGDAANFAVRFTGVRPGPGGVRVEVTATEGCDGSGEAGCVVTAPELAVRFGGPTGWLVNRDHAVTVTVANRGAADSRLVAVRLEVPDGWGATSPSGQFDPASRTLYGHADRLAAGASADFAASVRPPFPGPGDFRVTAQDLTENAAHAGCHAEAEIDPADGETMLDDFARAAESNVATPGVAAPAGVRASGREHQHVVFTVAGTDYALPLSAVREVGRTPAVTPVPHAPDWLAGVANVRGDVVSVADLRRFFGEPPGPESRDRRVIVVAASARDLTAGLLVDRVRGLRPIPPGEVHPPTAPIRARAAGSMLGVADAGGLPVVVLAPDALLLSPEFRQFEPA